MKPLHWWFPSMESPILSPGGSEPLKSIGPWIGQQLNTRLYESFLVDIFTLIVSRNITKCHFSSLHQDIEYLRQREPLASWSTLSLGR